MLLQVLTRSKLNVKFKHFLDLEMRASKMKMISLIDLILTCKHKGERIEILILGVNKRDGTTWILNL